MGIQKGVIMARKRYTAEQIIGHLRQAEILISQGKTVIEASRHLGVSEQTYYRWRKEYGGMEVAQVHRLKELEQENGRLGETFKPDAAQGHRRSTRRPPHR